MDLTPWRPFGEIGRLRREMDDLWSRFFGERRMPALFSQEWIPAVDVSETSDRLVVRMELPGLESEDIDVGIVGDVLTIKGEKKKETEEKDAHHHYVERYEGRFQRSLRVPVSVDTDKAEAEFEKGVLKIAFPKTEETSKKTIEIKVKQDAERAGG